MKHFLKHERAKIGKGSDRDRRRLDYRSQIDVVAKYGALKK